MRIIFNKGTLINFPGILIIIHGNPVRYPAIIIFIYGNFLGIGHVFLIQSNLSMTNFLWTHISWSYLTGVIIEMLQISDVAKQSAQK